MPRPASGDQQSTPIQNSNTMPQIDTVGDHVVKVIALRIGETENQNEFIEFDFSRDDGADIQGRLYLSEKALQTIKDGRAYGTIPTILDVFEYDLKAWNGDERVLATHCVGKYCSIRTVIETDQNGKDRIRVKYMNPLRRSAPIKDHGAFQNRLKMRLAKMPTISPTLAGGPKPAPSKPSTPPANKPPQTPPPAAAADDADPFAP